MCHGVDSLLLLLQRFDWLPPMATRKHNHVTMILALLRALCINFKCLLCICLSIAKSSHITGTRAKWVVPGIRYRRQDCDACAALSLSYHVCYFDIFVLSSPVLGLIFHWHTGWTGNIAEPIGRSRGHLCRSSRPSWTELARL